MSLEMAHFAAELSLHRFERRVASVLSEALSQRGGHICGRKGLHLVDQFVKVRCSRVLFEGFSHCDKLASLVLNESFHLLETGLASLDLTVVFPTLLV